MVYQLLEKGVNIFDKNSPIYLNAPGIRIHGTYSSSSIGTYASHGCIRMYISDSEELFDRVDTGTRVIIKP